MTVRIGVDRDVCELHGQCVDTAPEIFSFADGDGGLEYRPEVDDGLAAAAEDAVFLCPMQAITVTRG